MATRSLPHHRARGIFPVGLLHRFFIWRTNLRSRRRLLDLDDHLLADVGLDRAKARREAESRGWNAPDHWTR